MALVKQNPFYELDKNGTHIFGGKKYRKVYGINKKFSCFLKPNIMYFLIEK